MSTKIEHFCDFCSQPIATGRVLFKVVAGELALGRSEIDLGPCCLDAFVSRLGKRQEPVEQTIGSTTQEP
jgi:hypothetical protein